VINVVDNFDSNDLPVDVMWLDIEYTDGKKYFTWDPIKFAHPNAMITNLTSTGRKLVVIIDPHIKRESGYFLHEDCLANDYYVKNKDGNVYEGTNATVFLYSVTDSLFLKDGVGPAPAATPTCSTRKCKTTTRPSTAWTSSKVPLLTLTFGTT
jgi:hypothetical protein